MERTGEARLGHLENVFEAILAQSCTKRRRAHQWGLGRKSIGRVGVDRCSIGRRNMERRSIGRRNMRSEVAEETEI